MITFLKEDKKFVSSIVMMIAFIMCSFWVSAQKSDNNEVLSSNIGAHGNAQGQSETLTKEYIESLYPDIAEESIYFEREGDFLQVEVNTANYRLTGIQNELIELGDRTNEKLGSSDDAEKKTPENLKNQSSALLEEQAILKSKIKSLITKIFYMDKYIMLKKTDTPNKK